MARFDRENIKGRDLQALVGTAAEDLRTSLERQVQEVLSVAQQRAAEIERQADQNALEQERESQRRAQETVESMFARARGVLDSIELVQSALGGMLADLRAELEGAPHAAGARALAESPESGPELLSGDAKESTLAAKRDLSLGGAPDAERPESAAEARPRATGPAEGQPIATPANEQQPIAPPVKEERPAPTPVNEAEPMATQTNEEPPVPTPANEARPESLATVADEHPVTAKEQPSVTSAGAERSEAEESEGAASEGEASEASERGALVEEPLPEQPLPHPRALKVETQRTVDTGSAAQFDQMIRAQVRNMFRNGASRADVEKFLRRFRLGENYIDMLDDLRAEAAQGAGARGQGFIGRLRRRFG